MSEPAAGTHPEFHPATPQPAPLDAAQERNWAVAAHLSGFVAAYLALGFLGPLTVLLVAGGRSGFVRRHAVEALNFNLSILLYVVVSAVLVLVLVGIPLLLGIGVLYLVTVVSAALAASRGQEYAYPLSIRFIS